MDWREPSDDFARQLAAARATVLVNTTDPWRAVEPFEPILEEAKDAGSAREREEKLARIRSLGRQLFTEIRSIGGPVAMEIRHYCWHLQHLGDPDASPASSLTDMLMTALTRFAHYESHPISRCNICSQFPGDIPYRGSPGGRDHFNEWLKSRSGDEDG